MSEDVNENVLVARAQTGERAVQKPARALPFFRMLLPLVLALALPCLAAVLFALTLPAHLVRVPFSDISVSLYSVGIAAVFAIALVVGALAQESTFVHPLQKMRAWLADARASGFTSMPQPPDFDAGLAGQLGREIAASIALFFATSTHNKELSKQKSELLTIAAHQLRTPMTGVRWGVEQLLSPGMDAKAREDLGKEIDGMLRRMSLIVDNIVVSSDIDTDSAGYVFGPVDLVAALDKLVAEFEPIARERGVQLIFSHAAVALVRADSYRLSSAFFNLLSNAIDYTPSGGKVTLALEQKDNAVECSVADTGIGIPERDMGSIFSKFYRGEKAKHMRPDGSGLGLYLVKNIVTSHGSDVVIRSKDGAGTTVSFALPVAQAAN